jgi:hypothetical protein
METNWRRPENLFEELSSMRLKIVTKQKCGSEDSFFFQLITDKYFRHDVEKRTQLIKSFHRFRWQKR